MKKILVIGKSTLASKLKEKFTEIDFTIVGRPEYDISSQDTCDRIVKDFDHDTIILSQAVFDGGVWEQLTVNTVSLVYLATKFYEKLSKGQIICVSSASAVWPSWPGVDIKRLVYGLSKETISNFTKHMQRKIYDTEKPVAIQCYEPCRFPSKINNYSAGIQLEKVIKDVKYLIDNPHASHIRSIDV